MGLPRPPRAPLHYASATTKEMNTSAFVFFLCWVGDGGLPVEAQALGRRALADARQEFPLQLLKQLVLHSHPCASAKRLGEVHSRKIRGPSRRMMDTWPGPAASVGGGGACSRASFSFFFAPISLRNFSFLAASPRSAFAHVVAVVEAAYQVKVE